MICIASWEVICLKAAKSLEEKYIFTKIVHNYR